LRGNAFSAVLCVAPRIQQEHDLADILSFDGKIRNCLICDRDDSAFTRSGAKLKAGTPWRFCQRLPAPTGSVLVYRDRIRAFEVGQHFSRSAVGARPDRVLTTL